MIDAVVPTILAVLASAGPTSGGPSPRPAPALAPWDEPCAVSGRDVTPADVDRAMAACESARARFAELLGDPVPNVRVIVEDRRGYRLGIHEGTAVVFWPSTWSMGAGLADSTAAIAHVLAQWRAVLPHEISHALLSARFYPDGEFHQTGYGTPLPDWFEEGAAIWAEPAESRAGRLAAAHALPPARLELRSTLGKAHPAADDAEVMSIRDGAEPPADDALWNFYPRSFAVLSFIHDAGGRAAVRELARRLVANPLDPHALAGLPGLPAEFEGVEAAWRTWLAR